MPRLFHLMDKKPKKLRRSLGSRAIRLVASIDNAFDARLRRLNKRLGREGVPQILPYIGYANATTAWLHGRVLTNPPPAEPGEDDSRWRNVANTYRRFASKEVPDVRIEIKLGEDSHQVVTDREGYFALQAPHALQHLEQGMWAQAILKIVDHHRVSPEESATTAKLMSPPSEAQFGIISDVDDTVIHTGATHLLKMIRVTMFGNARTRVPLDGAAAFYQALQVGNCEGESPQNPVFYVSSSPWNLFDLIEDIFLFNNFPLGPILLRDIGFDRDKFVSSGHGHKLDKVRRIMAAYPELPFVLLGDSGQDDAMLYATAAAEYGPERIMAIFIRDVDPDADSRFDNNVATWQAKSIEAGVPMHRIRDSHAAALLAAEKGWIHPDRLDAIRAEVFKDKVLKQGVT
jgi:phosphatidate phosphatase APP1